MSLAVFVCVGFAARDARAAEDVSVVFLSTSDSVYRGVSEVDGEPAIAASVTWQPRDAFFLGVSGRFADPPNARQRHNSIDAYLGTTKAINDQWLGTLSVLRREFPGSVKEWQYTEYNAELSHANGLRLNYAFAPDYYAHNTRASLVEIEKTTFLSEHWYTRFESGAVALSSDRFDDYQYVSAGFGYTQDRLSLDVSYVWNSQDGSVLFGPNAVESPGLVVGFSYRLF